MRITNWQLVLGVILISIILVKCKDSFQEEFKHKAYSNIDNGYEPNPLLENLPHSDIEPSVIPLSEVMGVNPQWPKSFVLLMDYLRGVHDMLSFTNLTKFVGTIDDIHVISINNSTIVILDENKNRLIQYNIENHDYTELASEGTGPGDILFAKDLAFYDNNIFVSMQANRISKFDCHENPCFYKETIQTKFNNYSISPITDGLFVIGLSPIRTVDNTSKDINNYSAHYLNNKGEIRNSFNNRYKHNSLLVKEAINSREYIRTSTGNSSIYIGFSLVPFIYRYSFNNYKLIEKILIPNYDQRFYDYNIKRRAGGRRSSIDYSILSYMDIFSNQWLVYQLKHYEASDNGTNNWYSYYFMNIQDKSIYLLGKDEVNNRSIFVTEHGLIINQDGELFWVSDKQ